MEKARKKRINDFGLKKIKRRKERRGMTVVSLH
jgi:hypothetical protein